MSAYCQQQRILCKRISQTISRKRKNSRKSVLLVHMIGRVFRQNKKGGKSGETVPLTPEGGEEAAAAGAGPAGGHQE